jgi:hypothetical protein
MTHIPHFAFSAKEVLILVQALRICTEDGSIFEYAKKGEIEALRRKLAGGGDK